MLNGGICVFAKFNSFNIMPKKGRLILKDRIPEMFDIRFVSQV